MDINKNQQPDRSNFRRAFKATVPGFYSPKITSVWLFRGFYLYSREKR